MPLAEHKNPVIGKHPAEAYSNISQLKESKFWIIRSESVGYIGLKMNRIDWGVLWRVCQKQTHLW